MPLAKNWVAETSTTVGTGPITLDGSYLNRATFVQAYGGQAALVPYSIKNGNNWEAGICNFDGVDQLDRSTPLATFVGGVYNDTNPTAINLPAGQSIVRCSFNASDFSSFITESGVTYENLNNNGDVGVGAVQVAQGNHLHEGVYEPVDLTILRQGDPLTDLGSAAASNGQVPKADGVGNIVWENESGGSGEANDGSNVGAGEGTLFRDKTGVDLNFKTLKAGVNIVLTNNANEVQIDSPGSGGGEANTTSNNGVGGVGLALPKSGVNLPFKNIDAADARIVITDDVVNNEVDVGVDESQFNHMQDNTIHVTSDQSDALDNANAPDATNVFATAEDLFNNPSGGISLQYDWSTDNIASDPGAGVIKADSDDLTTATKLYVSDLTSAGNSADPAWLSWRKGDYVGVYDVKDADEGNSFKVDGPIIDNLTWFVVPVVPLATTGTPAIGNNRNVICNLVANPNSRMPIGGAAGQRLTKIDGVDYNSGWVDPGVPTTRIINTLGALYGGGDLTGDLNLQIALELLPNAAPQTSDQLYYFDVFDSEDKYCTVGQLPFTQEPLNDTYGYVREGFSTKQWVRGMRFFEQVTEPAMEIGDSWIPG